jgi:hypothetical protein
VTPATRADNLYQFVYSQIQITDKVGGNVRLLKWL